MFNRIVLAMNELQLSVAQMSTAEWDYIRPILDGLKLEYTVDVTKAGTVEIQINDTNFEKQQPPINVQSLEEKRKLLFYSLYATLTTTQINRALRIAGLQHQDWMELRNFMMKGKSE